VNGKQLEHQYVCHLSDFTSWSEKEHAEEWLLFEQNLGPHSSIDETSLSQGELYTIITNKEAKGKKGCLVAIIKGTDAEKVKGALQQIAESRRHKVEEVTLDMAASMEKIVRSSFPKAKLVTDRFHVQKLCYDALQQMRIEYRWQAIEQESKEIELAKALNRTFIPERLENGDSLKQLLARSRYLLFKNKNNWSASQAHRAEILFNRYPALEQAYNLCRDLAAIYEQTKVKEVAFKKLALWYNKVEKAAFKSFSTVARTITKPSSTSLSTEALMLQLNPSTPKSKPSEASSVASET
jgi:transposase